jgi:dihydrofolate synthase / folylpolyglutamate synthase
VSLAEAIDRIASEYPTRLPRSSLDAAARLRGRLEQVPEFPVVGVVGTNGKTSAATYLARLLGAAGARTGLYVSPHLGEWTERIRIDDEPCDPDELLEAVTTVHERARSGGGLADLRFFDVLTLAAERLLGAAEVDLAVFEAGIGGRLDAVRLLEPRLVLLTGVAIDHAELLGEEPGEILAEKLLVAPPGATVLSFSLGAELDDLAAAIAAERGLRLQRVHPHPELGDLPTFLRSALTLAEAGERLAAELLDAPVPPEPRVSIKRPRIDLRLAGRFERGERDGVPYVLDAGHNEAAWRLFAFELHRQFGPRPEAPPYTALFSVSPDKSREGLPDVLRSIPGLEAVIVTRHTALPAADPHLVARELTLAGVPSEAVEDVAVATRLALERARRDCTRLVVFGSAYLVGEVRARLLGAGSSSCA